MNKVNDKHRVIDLSTYPRRSHFEYFCSLSNPYVGVTVEVDVSDILAFCKKSELSFYLTFMHVVCKAANRVKELRQRIRDGHIIEYECCGTSHTESLSDGTYCYCSLEHDQDFDSYIRYAKEEQAKCRNRHGINESDDSERMYFISCLPWLSYTSLVQPTGGESNPHITWGRYHEVSGRMVMPVSILCHHALTDGVHISMFYEHLEEEMGNIINGMKMED